MKKNLTTLLLFSLFSFIIGCKNNNETVEFAKNPKVGDVWSIKYRVKNVGLVRVDKIVKDSIYVTFNDVEVDEKSKLKDTNLPEFFNDGKDGYTKKELMIMQAQDTIFDIIRAKK